MFGVLRDSISNLEVEPFACGWPAVNDGDVEENVIEIGFGNWSPYRPGHLLADPFVGESLAQSRQHFLVVERPGKPLLTLLDGQPISLIPASKPFLFELFERAERVAEDFVLRGVNAQGHALLDELLNVGRKLIRHCTFSLVTRGIGHLAHDTTSMWAAETQRVLMGHGLGACVSGYLGLLAASRELNHPASEDFPTGFRVATIPEPSTFALAALGILGVMAYVRCRAR